MGKSIRAASVQFEHAAGDKRANFAKIDLFLERSASDGAELLVFPECCITGYWFLRTLARREIKALAEPVPDGDSSRALVQRAKDTGIVIGAGLVEITGEGSLYNTYVVALPDGRVFRHRKLHCFVSEHMESGSDFTVFDSPFGLKLGALICYDCNIGENVRLTALAGAQIVLAPHQTGGCGSVNPHTMGLIDQALWEKRRENPGAIEEEFKGPKGRGWLMRWLPTRAHDNGIFMLFSNGVGVDHDEIRTGNAMIIDPYGRIIAETWKADDDLVVADLDLSLLHENTGQRWIRTRRPELYEMLAKPTGIEEETRSVRFDKKGV
jgi:predicted amidohydrolase